MANIKFELLDKVIEAIQKYGYKYQICPFETVVEYKFNEIAKLIETVHKACKVAGTEKMLVNMKLQSSFNSNVTIQDKMEKYS